MSFSLQIENTSTFIDAIKVHSTSSFRNGNYHNCKSTRGVIQISVEISPWLVRPSMCIFIQTNLCNNSSFKTQGALAVIQLILGYLTQINVISSNSD
jgi:hypothetical protein